MKIILLCASILLFFCTTLSSQSRCKIKTTEEISWRAIVDTAGNIRVTDDKTIFSLDRVEGVTVLTKKAFKKKILEENRRSDHHRIRWDAEGDWLTIEKILGDSSKLTYSSLDACIDIRYFVGKKVYRHERIDFGLDGLVKKHWKFNAAKATLARAYSCDRQQKIIVVEDYELPQIDSIWYQKGYVPYKKKRMRADSLVFTQSWMYIYNYGFNKIVSLKRNSEGDIILKQIYEYNGLGQLVSYHFDHSLLKLIEFRKRKYDKQGNIILDNEEFFHTKIFEGFLTPTEFRYTYNKYNDWTECTSLWSPPSYSGRKNDLRAVVTKRKIVYYENSCPE